MAAKWLTSYTTHIDKAYYLDIDWTPEPEQTFLLGSRWADFALCGVFALLLPLLRNILTRFVFEPLAVRAIYGNVKKTDAIVEPEKIRKFNESIWKMTVYIVFSLVAFLAAYKEPWFLDTRFAWKGCTKFPPCNIQVTKGVLLFYCIETGFYLQAIHFLTFIEVRRKDWLESMIHHVITVFLLSYSYHINLSQMGVMIILVHDISDIFLEAAKLARYARNETVSTVNFIIFAVSWIILRVIYFPLVLIKSTLIESLVYAEILGLETTDPAYTIINSLLLVLFVLHVYWTYLILKVVVRQFSGKELKDIRENDEGSDSD